MTERPLVAKASWEPKDDDKLRALAVLEKGVATIADCWGPVQRRFAAEHSSSDLF